MGPKPRLLLKPPLFHPELPGVYLLLLKLIIH